MCNHCRFDESGCCQWRKTCCGGGCCDDVNCCGIGTSTPNTGYQNTSYNYNSVTPSTKYGMGMNYGIGRTERQNDSDVTPKRGVPGPGPLRDEDTVPCVFQKEKYCVGGDCYLEEDGDTDELDKGRKTGQTLR